MYVKPVQIPCHVLQYEALLRRLRPGPARADVLSHYKRALAGYRGEQSMDYPLSYLPKESFYIFHNLRLPDHVHFFQIDFLILCARYVLILEVKNMSGTLMFDTDLHQLIRVRDGTIDVFEDPIAQLEQLADSLSDWLRKRGTHLPISGRVAIASSVQLQFEGLSREKICRVIRRANLRAELARLDQQFRTPLVSQHELDRASDLLLSANQPLIISLFHKFQISPEDVLTGVQCPDCHVLGMIKEKQHWRCMACGCISRKAHLAALCDYFHIYGTTITNRQCRAFLNIQSDTNAKKMLRSVSSHFKGDNRACVYYLSPDLLTKNQ
ncbi:NERD domain-containing protein [Sporolactobacillus sp. CPB3-1]|uniref:NERD domain-containing protein n=1 Tax=Sporolactobacillus mangiferae TaxID=2940498 RepID=A0ABT0MCZ0_9BACL|nr:nuclease-related domain-containing protein [Sporolactobacillus mangiferae]MCL1632731.1 NERD domain-containing protein [Sporolactobacillus mangiferae]